MNRKTSIAFIAAGLIAGTSAFAMSVETENNEVRMMGGKHRSAMMMSKLSTHMDKEFTTDQVRTLSEARLIMQGNPNVRVDEVKPTENGYSVTIVTQDNSLVEELKLAKNAMPLERYEALQKRMENRSSGELRERMKDRGERKARAGQRGHKGPRGQAGHKMMAREFTADQIETLTEAKLIMRGNDNLKLGKVTSTDNGYNVTIVTQDNSLVEEQQLAKNGMPLDRFEKIQKRIEARKAKVDAK
ncbi:hypothetical protein [Endozoicomonas montiporae]|nr:hypothetical protein [Endozoicomonas montiporae]AMO54861.1 hypothetical protein EZMO1_0621 [Endozoicomonas montiporae CL-33]